MKRGPDAKGERSRPDSSAEGKIAGQHSLFILWASWHRTGYEFTAESLAA